jgi:hypothetical protein
MGNHPLEQTLIGKNKDSAHPRPEVEEWASDVLVHRLSPAWHP